MLYDITKLKTQKPTRLLEVFDAAIDWGYVEQEKENPSDVPYFAELTMVFGEFSVTSHVITYPKFLIIDGEKKFNGWDIYRTTIDGTANMDAFGDCESLENPYDYVIDTANMPEYDNEQELADLLCDLFNDDFDMRSTWPSFQVGYPNGVFELIA